MEKVIEEIKKLNIDGVSIDHSDFDAIHCESLGKILTINFTERGRYYVQFAGVGTDHNIDNFYEGYSNLLVACNEIKKIIHKYYKGE